MTLVSVDKAALIGHEVNTSQVEILGLGFVTVQPLPRAVALRLQADGLGDAERDALCLLYGLADPVLTADEVARWQEVAPSTQIDPVTEAILNLSGIYRDAEKEEYKRLVSEPHREFDFFLAEKLHRTVDEMHMTLTNREYLGWKMYFGRKAQLQEIHVKRAKNKKR